MRRQSTNVEEVDGGCRDREDDEVCCDIRAERGGEDGVLELHGRCGS